MSLHDEYVAAGIPSMGCNGARVALSEPYKTATGQWVIDNGAAEWEGTGTPTTGPDAAMIAKATTTHGTYVAPAHVVAPSSVVILRALAKQARSKTLTQEEEDALDYVEAQ